MHTNQPALEHTTLLTCTCCGTEITRAEWLGLRLIGPQESPGDPWELELRNCRCGTTLSLPVPIGAARRLRREVAILTGRLAVCHKWHEAAFDYMRPSWAVRGGGLGAA
jgi:hypothetical protein